jgi:5-hydroxyisourate hydrolase-like protein (transthyretin family)
MKPSRHYLWLTLALTIILILSIGRPPGAIRVSAEAISTASLTPSAAANVEPLVVAQAATATRTPSPINVGNFVWDDRDHDGRQDAGEPGLSGVIVQLWNGAKTQLIQQTTTNANGNYTLVAPSPGQYRVRVLLPHVNDQFSPKDAVAGDDLTDSDINPSGADLGFTDIYNFASNLISITSIDAGIRRYVTPTPTRTPSPINVGNFVWDDLDHDGRQDAGEPGLSGVTVQLWNSAKTQLIQQTTTNANGNYTLVAPSPGDYRVRVLLPHVNDQFSPKDAVAGDDLTDSDINPSGADAGFTDVYSFASNLISITSIDAGIRIFKTPTPTRTPSPISVGNRVWRDTNGNGVQDAGEPGIAGVTVQLWNGAKTQLIQQTTTNANGNYTLVAPGPGDYRVRVLKFYAGDQFSPKNASVDDTLDSDINPSGADAGFTDIYNFASNLISITSIDAGFSYLAPTPTPTLTPSRTPTIPAPNAPPALNFSRQSFTRFSWNSVSWAVGYAVEVDTEPNFASPDYSTYSLAASARTWTILLPSIDAVYYWRVGAKRADGTIVWSATQTLTVDAP